MKLIGIAGHAGAGKDITAKMVQVICPKYKIYHFADALKECCAAAFGIPLEHFTYENFKNSKHPYWGVSPREIAQFVGTELFRDNIARLILSDDAISIEYNFWVERLLLQLARDFIKEDEVYAIIADVRFQNEVDWILQNDGLIIHLERNGAEGKVGIAGHSSEAGFTVSTERKEGEGTYIKLSNNGTLAELYTNISFMLNNLIHLNKFTFI